MSCFWLFVICGAAAVLCAWLVDLVSGWLRRRARKRRW
jgi:hypothetical protein